MTCSISRASAAVLLTDPYAPQEGIEALKTHNADGLKSWQSFLSF